MTVALRPLQPADLELLKNLWQCYELETSTREQSDVNTQGRFPFPDEEFALVVNAEKGNSGYAIECDGACAGFVVLLAAQIEGKPITEFADLYVLPRYRGRGVASVVVEQVILQSDRPWLIAVFRDDVAALAFWRSAFSRLAFASWREIVPPELAQFHEFVVNERGAPALASN